jgi:cysteine-rich repeat protein
MRSRAWFIAVGSILCVAGTQGACGPSGVGSGGTGGTGGKAATSTTTTGGSTGGNGGGGGNATPDNCPGEAHSLGLGKLTLMGSTVGLKDDIQVNTGKCQGGADTSGPDAVYKITFTKSATVTTTLTGTNGLDAILITETTCGDMTTVDSCVNQTTSGSEQTTFAVAANETLFFIVDGNKGSDGDFTLEIDAAAPACGDGYINTGEQCDDGNTTSGDGCSSTCMTEMPMDTSDTCPGLAVPLALSVPIDIKGMMYAPAHEATTSPYVDDYTTCDGVGPPPQGKDRVFQVIPAVSGTMHVELRNIGSNGGFDGMLSAYKDTCGFDSMTPPGPALAFDFGTGQDAPSGTYLGCSDQAGGMSPYVAGDITTYEVLQDFTVIAGESIFVVVDGYQDGSEGEFWLHLELNP